VNRVEKESAYLSEMGIYFTDTAAGRVGGLDPGDPGYREAVLAQVRLRKLFAADPPGTLASLELPSTTSFGWYLIANGSTESLAQGQGEMFFSHAAANRDGLSHIHARGDADKTLQVAGLATDMFRSLEAPEGFNRLNPIRWQPELVLQHVAQLGDHHLAGEQGVVGEHLLQQVGAETAGREGAHQHIRVEEQAHQLGGCSAHHGEHVVGEEAGRFSEGDGLGAQTLKAHQLQLAAEGCGVRIGSWGEGWLLSGRCIQTNHRATGMEIRK